MIIRKYITLICTLLVVACLTAVAAVPVATTEKARPTDNIFMEMATTAAAKSVVQKGKPCGAVVILNNAFKGTGIADATKTAEENAITTSRLGVPSGAVIYTVCEPTAAGYNAICRSGAKAVYFVVPREMVIGKGIYPVSAYDDGAYDATLKQVPLRRIDYADAAALIK